MIKETLFFGSTQNSYEPALFHGKTLLNHEPFAAVGKQLGLKQLVFVHQVHGTDGLVLTQAAAHKKTPSFVVEADYLLTNVPGIGLGVSTADCLPVVMFDPVKSVVGAIHAGWRGARSNIIGRAIERAQEEFGSCAADLEFHFGPSAHGCCYEVQSPFAHEFAAYPFAIKAFRKEGDRLYFDLPTFAALQLQSLGVKKINKHKDCTVCIPGYCSVRKNAYSPQRQMTVVTLANF